jgi:pimeloyl-ACP methyl ester carboxylesterase
MMRPTVVYVHGLWLTGQESLWLRRRLANDFGFDVHVFRYATVSNPIARVVSELQHMVQKLAPQTLHLIGHSLGGLVIYRFLESFPQQPPGRVVFLGTPALGSRAAVSAARARWIGSLMGRCIAEEILTARERRWVSERSLGIIAGSQPLGLGRFFANFDDASDGTILVSETRLPGATDHITLPVSHMGMLLSSRVARATGTFLRDGRFALA